MTDPFRSSMYSIDHAQRRIVEFEEAMAAFTIKDTCRQFVERDLDTLEDVHKVKFVRDLPVILPGCAFDVVNNLRSSLDQAGYTTATAKGGSGRHAHFPFGLNRAEVQRRNTGRSQDIPPEIFDVMVACEPYRGGNDLLWCLNELCNTNKHETIMLMGAASFTHTMETANSDWSAASFDKWDSTKNELEFARTPHNRAFTSNFNISAFIAIGNIDIISRVPAARVLNNLLGVVKRVLMAIEAEASRIGLFR